MSQNNETELTVKFLLKLQIPSTHACYADHFPNDPLVPGALLLKWINAEIENYLATRITHYKQIKFLAPVRPGDLLTIDVQGSQESEQFLLDVKEKENSAMKGSFRIQRSMTERDSNQTTANTQGARNV